MDELARAGDAACQDLVEEPGDCRAPKSPVPDPVHQLDLQPDLRALLLLAEPEPAGRPDVEEFFALSRELGRSRTSTCRAASRSCDRSSPRSAGSSSGTTACGRSTCPTNGYFTDQTIAAVRGDPRQRAGAQLFAVELSLDGMPEFHDRFRGNPRRSRRRWRPTTRWPSSSRRTRACASTRSRPRPARTSRRSARLTTFLFERCPAMDHHNLAIIRGDRKNPSLSGPDAGEVRASSTSTSRRSGRPREQGRFGAIVEPMLHWAKAADDRRRTPPVRPVPARAS